MDILSKLPDFKKMIPESDLGKEEAIRNYRELGGILRFDESDKENHRIIYPNKERIGHQLVEAKRKRRYLDLEVRQLRRKYTLLAYDNVISAPLRIVDPLYWEHLIRKGVDKDYRRITDVVEPPISKMHSARWRKMVKMFVKNKDYRDRLLEAKTSIIGKNRMTVSKTIERNTESTKKLLRSRIEKLEKERDNFLNKARVLQALSKWVDES